MKKKKKKKKKKRKKLDIDFIINGNKEKVDILASTISSIVEN